MDCFFGEILNRKPSIFPLNVALKPVTFPLNQSIDSSQAKFVLQLERLISVWWPWGPAPCGDVVGFPHLLLVKNHGMVNQATIRLISVVII